MKNYEAIIFDMDGVLFDTEGFYYHRREIFLASKRISIKHLPPSFFIGGNMKQVWKAILCEDYDKWDVASLQKEYTDYKNTHPLPYKELIFSDTKKVVSELKKSGLRLALASSSTMNDIKKALRDTKLDTYFDIVLSGEDFPESKPDPAIYNEAARQLGFPKENLLIIEDSEKGIAAGVSAGIEVWAVEDHLYGMNQSAAHRFINNLSEAFDLIFNANSANK